MGSNLESLNERWLPPPQQEESWWAAQPPNVSDEEAKEKIKEMIYTLVKRIKRSGWPVYTKSGKVSQKWKKGHAKANRAAREKYGSMVAKAINRIKVRKDELLGSHTRKGKIRISKIVPRRLRKAIAYHEKVENRYMTKRKR